MHTYNQEIKKIYQLPDSHSSNLLTRIKTDSEYFLGRPYLLGPTGEGPKALFDQNPMYRTDQFDCLTYVETVLALVKSNNVNEFSHNLKKIRYHSTEYSFLYRNHFTELDWNPQNQRNGYIKDVTQALFPQDYKFAVIMNNKPEWFKRLPASSLKLFVKPSKEKIQSLLTNLHDLSKQTQTTQVKIAYIPLTAFFDNHGKPIQAMFDRIPDGSIIEIVRPNWDLRKLLGTHIVVSHLGFGLRINHVLMFREASSDDMKVEDLPLDSYLKKYLNHKTVKGIHIEQIQ